VANLRAVVSDKDASEDGHHIGDAQLSCPALLTGKSMKRHLAHERHRIVERPQKCVDGRIVRVVIEESQTTAPYPRVGVGDRCELHLGDWNLGNKLVPLLVGQRVPSTKKLAYHVRLGARLHRTIKHPLNSISSQ
jgi:hypothetical protein